jgi:type II secretory pathway pseudopilin PulG
VTLTEVLMSLMIMSIGVSAVAVLFPISVLRSVQATQLTNAAILKVNAETLFSMQKGLVFDPDGDGNLDEHIGRSEELQYIVDPSGYFDIATATGSWAPNPWLNSTVPVDPNDPTYRGAADWFGNVDSNADGVPEIFGFIPRYDGGVRTGTVSGTYPIGYSPLGGDPEEARALRYLGSTLSKLGDAWDTQYEAIPEEFVFSDGSTSPTAAAGASIVGVRFSVDADLSAIPTGTTMVPRIAGAPIIPDPEICRIVIFSADGNFSAALPLTAVDDATGYAVWTEDRNWAPFNAQEDLNGSGTLDVRRLPEQFVNTATGMYEIGRVLLQSSRTHDYNWLLTVRRGRDGQARGADVVITHNSKVTPDDERLYSASFDTRTDAFNSPWQIEVLKDGGAKEGGTEPIEPAIRKNGYVFDLQNARWYRIRDYVEQDVTVWTAAAGGPITGPGYLISVETQVLENSPTIVIDPGPPVYPRYGGQVMFLPGVIDVYPMGSIAVPPNL